MGYMRDHALLVSSWNSDLLQDAHDKAISICAPLVSDIVAGVRNGHGAFFVAPDGSKEGWAESAEWDARRSSFIRWLDRQRYEDGSTALRWALVQWADDNHETKIVRHSDSSE